MPAEAAENAVRPGTRILGARFGGGVYAGRPKLQTTLALVVAGGGPSDFKTIALLEVLAGSNANAEVAALTRRFGANDVKAFITTFDFVVADALRLVKKNALALPAIPDPDPKDGKALSKALYIAGVEKSGGTFSVEYMLDHLVSHALHVRIMQDVVAKYGVRADATYHVALQQVVTDLASADGR